MRYLLLLPLLSLGCETLRELAEFSASPEAVPVIAAAAEAAAETSSGDTTTGAIVGVAALIAGYAAFKKFQKRRAAK
jgi:hypothetical protein